MIDLLACISVALIAVLAAHIAGSRYVIAANTGQSSKYAVLHTVFSLALVLLLAYRAR